VACTAEQACAPVTMSTATTDLSDAHPEAQVCDPLFRSFGGRRAFHGPIKTLKVFDDNTLVRRSLEGPGGGRALVVDGGGSMRCALLGGNLARLAADNGWSGVLVNGYVRDAAELEVQPVGVLALGTHPRKSRKGTATGHEDEAVTFAGVTFRSGDWLYADADGVLVSEAPIHPGA
jgi:regulator of ribonuclease activity A